MMQIKGWIFSLITLAFFVLGVYAGVIVRIGNEYNFQETSVKTCQYSNNLTDIINFQSATIGICTGNLNYTKLNKLNCSLLSGDPNDN